MLSHYPSISEDEFARGCETFERKCHDNLSGTNWLSVRWHDGELEIKQASGKVERQPNSEAGVVAGSDYDEKTMDSTDDEDAIIRQTAQVNMQDRPAVDFSILLSPTYRCPVLWFTLSSTKFARVQDLEEIYSRVVAPGSHESLRGIGIMGGISLANHPITDKPTFFLHPCNTPEAMLALNDGSKLDAFRYLLLWFGVAGAGIGLHVPSKIAA